MITSGRFVAAAVQVAAPAAPNKYFETQTAAASNLVSLAVPGSPPAKARAAGHGAAVSGSERQSPRNEWRQQFRMASGSIQLNSDAFQANGASFSRARPSTAPRERSLQAHPQLFESSVATQEHAAVALLQGRSLTGSTHAAKRHADAVTAIVPAPPVL